MRRVKPEASLKPPGTSELTSEMRHPSGVQWKSKRRTRAAPRRGADRCRGAARAQAPRAACGRPRQAQLAVQLRPLHQLGLGRQRLGGERLGRRGQLAPGGARQEQRIRARAWRRPRPAGPTCSSRRSPGAAPPRTGRARARGRCARARSAPRACQQEGGGGHAQIEERRRRAMGQHRPGRRLGRRAELPLHQHREDQQGRHRPAAQREVGERRTCSFPVARHGAAQDQPRGRRRTPPPGTPAAASRSMVTASTTPVRRSEEGPEEEQRAGREHGAEDHHPPARPLADVAAGETEGDPERGAGEGQRRGPDCPAPGRRPGRRGRARRGSAGRGRSRRSPSPGRTRSRPDRRAHRRRRTAGEPRAARPPPRAVPPPATGAPRRPPAAGPPSTGPTPSAPRGSRRAPGSPPRPTLRLRTSARPPPAAETARSLRLRSCGAA